MRKVFIFAVFYEIAVDLSYFHFNVMTMNVSYVQLLCHDIRLVLFAKVMS